MGCWIDGLMDCSLILILMDFSKFLWIDGLTIDGLMDAGLMNSGIDGLMDR